jgi:nitroimidazol reductase NimA-like FMN-containing flavoprotein (pyridoxamine 5'-phosphate oxidase superfamily)
MSLPQGDLQLLEGDVARRLLASTLPGRVAYTAADGTPRIVPTWFQWTGTELAMPTFIAAPHVQRPPSRITALRTRPDVAVSIDTENFPPEVLLVRGRAEITEVDGVDPDYAAAALRYMGEEVAEGYLQQITDPATRMARITVRPTWVGVVDFQTHLPGPLGGVQPEAGR